MKSRFPKIVFVLALALPCNYATARLPRSVDMNDVTATVKFYADIPSRVNDAVSNFKRLPERMDPTSSECSEP